jgi:Arc-like DNA binding domain
MDSQSEIRITLRLPADLRDRLAASADANSRSMNGEIVFRLDDYDRAVRELAETDKLLEEREIALFNDRARLSALVGPDGDVSALIEAKQQEIDDLRKRLMDSQEVVARVSSHNELLNQVLSRISEIERKISED